jgi:hypothetical protein
MTREEREVRNILRPIIGTERRPMLAGWLYATIIAGTNLNARLRGVVTARWGAHHNAPLRAALQNAPQGHTPAALRQQRGYAAVVFGLLVDLMTEVLDVIVGDPVLRNLPTPMRPPRASLEWFIEQVRRCRRYRRRMRAPNAAAGAASQGHSRGGKGRNFPWRNPDASKQPKPGPRGPPRPPRPPGGSGASNGGGPSAGGAAGGAIAV